MCTNKILQQNEPQNKILYVQRGKSMIKWLMPSLFCHGFFFYLRLFLGFVTRHLWSKNWQFWNSASIPSTCHREMCWCLAQDLQHTDLHSGSYRTWGMISFYSFGTAPLHKIYPAFVFPFVFPLSQAPLNPKVDLSSTVREVQLWKERGFWFQLFLHCYKS